MKAGRVVALLVAVILGIMGANWWYASLEGERGTFGDMFGASNALFSGLAFAGVAYAIILQRAEVAIARAGLAASQAIQREQARLTQVQQEALARQMFEGTFFKLLDLFVHLVDEIDIETEAGRVLRGKDAFVEVLREVEGAGAIAAYEAAFLRYKSDLGHYFRTLTNMLKFVDNAAIAEHVDTRLYTNLIRAQISDPEATVLALHALSRWGAGLKPLLEDYALLKNADLDGFEGIAARFDARAFEQG